MVFQQPLKIQQAGFRNLRAYGKKSDGKLSPRTPFSVSNPDDASSTHNDSRVPKRLIFRVLRANEEFNDKLLPRKALRPDKDIKQEVNEQVLYGSSSQYIGALMSFTAELNVAVAFGGLVSRIAVADLSTLPRERVVALDKSYLRDIELSNTLARARSRRSDEILVGTQISEFKLLDMEIVSCKRTLAPGFDDDERFFPSETALGNALTNNREMLEQTPIGGPNKRMFRIKVGGKKFVAHPPRPNVCLDGPILFGEDLVSLSLHEFAARSCFRVLCPDHVARGAHYLFNLRYREVKGFLNASKSTFQWAFTLLEDFCYPPDSSPSLESELQQAMEKLYMADVILGNWACVNKKEAAFSTLCSPDEMVYGRRSSDNKIVRIMVDRSLGCTYAEDLHKDVKNIVPFTSTNALDLREIIGSYSGYSRITKSLQSTLTMDLQLHSQAKQQRLFECLGLSPWPDLAATSQQHTREKLKGIVMKRIFDVLQTLPYRVLEPNRKPPARDGHAAVAINTSHMFIFGGNSVSGPLKDTWRYDVKKNEWLQYPNLPSPRYSHSGHAFAKRWLVSFGGHLGPGFGVVSELLVMDLNAKDPCWKQVVQLENANLGSPGPRCRHSSVLVPDVDGCSARIFVVAGHNSQEKLADVWQGKLDFTSPDQVTVRWSKYRDLSRPCHRHFVFLAADSSLVVLGGFGQSLMKLRVIAPYDEAGLTNNASDIVTTSHALTFNIFKEFEHSKSHAGFAAVFDDESHRVFLFGGGNVGERAPRGQGAGFRDAVATIENSSGSGRGGAFGAPANNLARPSRAFILSSRSSSRRGGEWTWSTFKDLADLPESYQLPLWHSWTGCLMGDEVLLFGGRGVDDAFSDQLHSVRVRKNDGSGEERARLMFLAQRLNRGIVGSAKPKESAAAVRTVLTSLETRLEVGQTATLDHSKNMHHQSCVRILCTYENAISVGVRRAAALTNPDLVVCSPESSGVSNDDMKSISFHHYNDDVSTMAEIQGDIMESDTLQSEIQARCSTVLPTVWPHGLTVTAIRMDRIGLDQISSLLHRLGPAPHLIWGIFEAKLASSEVDGLGPCKLLAADANSSSFKLLKFFVAGGYLNLETREQSAFLASPSLAPRLLLRQHSVHSIPLDTEPSSGCFRRSAFLARLEIDASKRLVGICGPSSWGETGVVEYLKSFFLKQHPARSLSVVKMGSDPGSTEGVLEALEVLNKNNVVVLIGTARTLLNTLPAMDALFVVVSNEAERKRRFFETSKHFASEHSVLTGQWNDMEAIWKSDFKDLKRLQKVHGEQIKLAKDEAEFEQLAQRYFAQPSFGAEMARNLRG